MKKWRLRESKSPTEYRLDSDSKSVILNINPIVLVNCKNKPGWSLCNERFTKTERPPASEVPAVHRDMCRPLLLLLRRLCPVLEPETQALLFLPLLVVFGDAGKRKKERKKGFCPKFTKRHRSQN